MPGEITKLEADLAAGGNPERRAQLEADLCLAESYLAEVTALKPALPTMSCAKRAV